MATNEQVIISFLRRDGKHWKTPTNNLSHDNSQLKSYRTVIARHASMDGRLVIEVNKWKYSVTTSRHQSKLRFEAKMLGFDVVDVEM